MDCEYCFHKRVCFQQYGDNAKKWAEENGCKNFVSKDAIIVLPLPVATVSLREELEKHCFNRCIEEL